MAAQTISAAPISPFLFILPLIPPKTIASKPYQFAARIYEAVVRVALKRHGIDRAEVSSAVHESNSGHRRGEVK
jgi:hypothetical protein